MDYSNIKLKPNYSEKRRGDIDLTTDFLGYKFNLPVVPANMTSVIDFKLAVQLARKGYFYIMHRFYPYDEIFRFVQNMTTKNLVVSISIGVQQKDYDFVDQLVGFDPDFITIDVAHGDHVLVKNMIQYVKSKLTSKVIAGNVGSVEAVNRLKTWGADAVKLGIAPSSVCRTYNQTGVKVHPAEFYQDWPLPVIADGGVTMVGDIAKALVLGYEMVMVGRLFAGFDESPVEEIDGYKIYEGSTAKNLKYKEGDAVMLPVKGSIWDFLDVVEQGLQSSASYCGGSFSYGVYEIS